MPEEPRHDDPSHIAIAREPDLEMERRRRRPPPPPPRVAGRAQHGSRIANEVATTAASAGGTRQEAGLDPSRLLVLEFATWNAKARDAFERLSAMVVDESRETLHLTRVIMAPVAGEKAEAVAARIEAARTGGRDVPAAVERLRLRQANKGDIAAARKAGAVVPEARASRPSDLVVLDATDWDPATEQALRDLGLSPVATTRATAEITRVLVQFPTIEGIRTFEGEARYYVQQEQEQTALPRRVRQDLFDGLEWVRPRGREDRLGARLRQEGFPDAERFALDVDLFHPGTAEAARDILDELRSVCERHGGRVADDLRTSSLVLARVEADRSLAEILLNLNSVAQVNLPPVLPAAYGSLFEPVLPLRDHQAPDGSEPVITVVDSGVLAGHPLLRGWVLEERDFDSGENTALDRHGHGPGVAGLVVYGDVAGCIETGDWTPRAMVASAKVLRRDPFDPSRPVFPENRRPEKLVEDAVRFFHRERGCRVFNLSVGNPDDVYAGGRQFAWAEVLDHLARELDIVLVVSAGNVASPPWPQGATTSAQFQSDLRDLMLDTPAARVCSPATAAIAVTTGAIARSDATARHLLVAAPAGAPAPFSRLGPGYGPKPTQRAIKPEFVSFGGNYAIRGYAGVDPRWVPSEIQLGEPTTRLNTDGGRPLTAVSGTSFAAPQVSFAAAFALRAAGDTLGTAAAPTANTARALLGACAEMPPCGPDWLLDPEGKETWEKLRLVGYGRVHAERVMHALRRDVCLLAEDGVAEDHWHLYALRVPPAFLGGRGRRGINVSLAFDPPVRASRRDYLSRTMWVEVLKGLTATEIDRYRSRHTGKGRAPTLPDAKLLKMRPPKSDVQWSTLQVRRYSWSRACPLPVAAGQEEPVLHVLVGCQRRFSSGEGPNQRYALAVRLWHTDDEVDIHQQLRSRVRLRAVSRLRVARRG